MLAFALGCKRKHIPGYLADVALQQAKKGVIAGIAPSGGEFMLAGAIVLVEILEHVGEIEECDARSSSHGAGSIEGEDEQRAAGLRVECNEVALAGTAEQDATRGGQEPGVRRGVQRERPASLAG